MQLLRVIRVCHRHVLQKNFTPEIKKMLFVTQLSFSPVLTEKFGVCCSVSSTCYWPTSRHHEENTEFPVTHFKIIKKGVIKKVL